MEPTDGGLIVFLSIYYMPAYIPGTRNTVVHKTWKSPPKTHCSGGEKEHEQNQSVKHTWYLREGEWPALPEGPFQSKTPRRESWSLTCNTFHSCPGDRACWAGALLSLHTGRLYFGLGFLSLYCSLALLTYSHRYLFLNRISGKIPQKKHHIAL